MPTIKDVAREAGVSIATVSYVLNNKLEAVSEDTRQQVWDAIQRIGYTPNVTARNLRSSRTRLIGYAWRQVERDQVSPVLDRFMYFLANTAEKGGYHILTFTYEPDDPVRPYDDLIRTGRVDAIVTSATTLNDRRIAYLKESGIPFVSFGRSNPDWEFSWVDTDGAAGTRAAVDHLVALGHRRFAFAGWDKQSLAGEFRLQGFVQGLGQHGLYCSDSHIFRGEQTEESGAQALRTFLQSSLSEQPTAVVCVSDLVAIGVMNEAERHGLQVGRDVSVVGFDDAPLVQYLRPALTTIRQPVQSTAETIIATLNEQLGQNVRERAHRQTLLRPELIVRASTGRAPQ